MCDYYYVTKEEAAPFKERIFNVIGMIYDDLTRKYDDFDFEFKFSGPSANNMISYDKTNREIGIEFDVDIILNKRYNADQTIEIFKDAFNIYCRSYNYQVYEDNDEMDITFNNGEFTCSLHFVAETNKKSTGIYKYIVYDEENQNYIWINSNNKYRNISEEINWLKSQKLWMRLRNDFLYKRDNCEECINSKDMFFISVHDIAVKEGMYKLQKSSSDVENQKKKKENHSFEYVTHKEAILHMHELMRITEKKFQKNSSLVLVNRLLFCQQMKK